MLSVFTNKQKSYEIDRFLRFDVNQPCFFTPAIRSRIVHFILDRKRFTLGKDDDFAFGVDRLIDQGVYIAAYPLHDVSVNKFSFSHSDEKLNQISNEIY